MIIVYTKTAKIANRRRWVAKTAQIPQQRRWLSPLKFLRPAASAAGGMRKRIAVKPRFPTTLRPADGKK